MNFLKTDLNKVKRIPKRGSYDKVVIAKILKSQFMAQINYVYDGYPISIPMAYGYKNNEIYIHGANKNRLMTSIMNSDKVSATITKLESLVLAKSTFHHSMNYQSVVIFGKAEEISDPADKMLALKIITDQIIKHRWEESRQPNSKEINATTLVRIKIETASAKIREGDPIDDKEDQGLPIWSGLLPLKSGYLDPIPDQSSLSLEIPKSIKTILLKKG